MNKRGIEKLSEQIVMLTAKVYPLFRQVFKDYHPDEILVLHILRANDGELQRRELIKSLEMDQKIVSRRIRNLVSRGLVESYRNLNSARESIDKITEKGNQEFNNLRNKMKLLLEQSFAFLNIEEQKILENIVDKTNIRIEVIAEIIKRLPQL